MRKRLILPGFLLIFLITSPFSAISEEVIKDEKIFIQKFSEAFKANDQVRMKELVRQAGPQIVYNVIVSESTRGIASVAEGMDGTTHFNPAESMAILYAREFKKEDLLEQVRKYKLYDQEMGREKLKGDALVRQGLSSYGQSRWEESQRQFNEALVAFDKIGDLFGRSKALDYMGNTDIRLGNYEQALGIYQQGLELKQRIGDMRGEAGALSNIGATYNSLKQYDEALKFYNQSLERYQKIKDQAGETQLLREIENIHEILKKDSGGR